MNKYFLSVIIPTHNCEDTIERLLNSIYQYDEDNTLTEDMIECIVVDDNSTDNTILNITSWTVDHELEDNIKVLHTDREIHCPGNTREIGLRNATGEWVTFIDHDDYFHDGALQYVYDRIINKNEKYMVSSTFAEIDGGRLYRIMDGLDGGKFWTHGKFYNKKNLLDPSNVHFINDMVFHEDVYFNISISCYMNAHNIDPLYTDNHRIVYAYIYNSESFSKREFTDDTKLTKRYLQDYIYSLTEPFINAIKTYGCGVYDFKMDIVDSLIKIYLFIELLKHKSCADNMIYTDNYFHDLISRICKECDITVDDIIEIAYSNPEMYYKEKELLSNKHGYFLEYESFRDFIQK